MVDLYMGKVFVYFECELVKFGVFFDFNFDCEVLGCKFIENFWFVCMIWLFLIYVKSNCFLVREFRKCLDEGVVGVFKFCYVMFFGIFEWIWEWWEEWLWVDGSIDFEDMFNQVVDCVE